jgi:hypothetical protein
MAPHYHMSAPQAQHYVPSTISPAAHALACSCIFACWALCHAYNSWAEQVKLLDSSYVEEAGLVATWQVL